MNEIKKSIKISAPATVANVGCGYDTMGFALDSASEEILIEKRRDNRLVIKSVEGANISSDSEANVATIAVKSLLDFLDVKAGFDFTIRKLFLPGSGLGSSASSAAGAVFGVNKLLSSPLTIQQLLPFALEGEAFASKCYHADNVAPALLGGIVVIRSYDPLDYFFLPVSEDLKVLIVKPEVEIKTAEAKELVPKEIPVSIARDQWGNLASLVHAFHTKDWGRLKWAIKDYIAEPVRKSLIPKYDEVGGIGGEYGCVGFNISGSGPSIFMLFRSNAERADAKKAIANMYEKDGISCQFFSSAMSEEGCKVISK